MQRIVHLHIGMGRAGSSAIQLFCQANRPRLARAGVAYPLATDLGFTGAAARGGNATGLARELRSKDATDTQIFRVLDDVAERFRALRGMQFLLSSEYLFSLPEQRLQHLKDRFEAQAILVKVIVYLREQRSWFMSRYAQAVKSKRWTQPLDEYIEHSFRTDSLDYAARCRELAAVFGRDNLTVRLFERDRMRDGDVRKDIAGLVGVDAADFKYGSSDDNSSADVLELEMMRVLNQLGDGAFDNRAFLKRSKQLRNELGAIDMGDLYRLVPPQLMESARQHYVASNEQLRREFFPEVQGELFKSKIPADYDTIFPDQLIDNRALLILCKFLMSGLSKSDGQGDRLAVGSKPSKLRAIKA